MIAAIRERLEEDLKEIDEQERLSISLKDRERQSRTAATIRALLVAAAALEDIKLWGCSDIDSDKAKKALADIAEGLK